jgi:regulator of replication initiation timing
MGRVNPRQKISLQKKKNKRSSKKHIKNYFAIKAANQNTKREKGKGSSKSSQEVPQPVTNNLVERSTSPIQQDAELSIQVKQLQQQLQEQEEKSRSLSEENENLRRQLGEKSAELETTKEEARQMFFFRNKERSDLKLTCDRLRQERAEAYRRADAAHNLLTSYQVHLDLHGRPNPSSN